MALPDICGCKFINNCPSGLPGPKGPKGKPGIAGIDGINGVPGKNALDVTPQSQELNMCYNCPSGPQGNLNIN